jgi:RNA 2',3'-cyclic 3'-phosphodiesterase
VGKRLFVAVDIDDPTRDAVDHLSHVLRQHPATERLGRTSWVSKDRMHLTLHFVADADAVSERVLVDALGHLVQYSSFNLMFQGLGFFPERGAPRVLWLGITQGLDKLRAIHADFSRRLRLASRSRVRVDGGEGSLAERSRETFNPHLTLARFRDRVPRERLAEITAFPAAAGPSQIDRVTLYESRLSPKGPTYTAVAEAALKVPS